MKDRPIQSIFIGVKQDMIYDRVKGHMRRIWLFEHTFSISLVRNESYTVAWEKQVSSKHKRYELFLLNVSYDITYVSQGALLGQGPNIECVCALGSTRM